MSRSPFVSVLADGVAGAVPNCVQDSTTLCARVYDWFGLDWLAANADALIATPAKMLLIVVLAAVVRGFAHRGIRRLTDRTATGSVPTILRPRRFRAPQSAAMEQLSERRTQRAEAIGSVLRSVASIVVLGIAVVLVLGELGINLAPIVASAGIVGVALGFGAQNLIKDFIAGIGIILEDQYGVGDVVDLGAASGTVEAVGLRITRLRDVNGVVWYVRNGEVLRVGNKSQGFGQVVIDMPVAHDTDLERCRRGDAGGRRRARRRGGVGRRPPGRAGVAGRRAHHRGGRLPAADRAHDERRPVAGRPRTADAAEGAVRRGGHPHAGPRARERPCGEGGGAVTAQSSEGAVTGAPERPATFREVFAVREFRPLFGTYLLSTAGDELARVALTVLVYQRTASPLLSALTFAIGHLPWLLGGPVLSTLADRLPRHRVLIATDTARALLLGRDGHPGHAPAGPARPAVPGLVVRATVRVRALRAHGRRARGRPLRRRHLADQHHAAVGPGRRLPGGRRARRRAEPLGRPCSSTPPRSPCPRCG